MISQIPAHAERLAGFADRAYDLLAEAHTTLAATGYTSMIAGMRAQADLDLGRVDEAMELAAEAERLAAPDDPEPYVSTRLVRAGVLTRRGDLPEAERLIREAAVVVEPTDYAILHQELAFAQAGVARAAGHVDTERRALERAVEVAQAKGNVVATKGARERFAELKS